MMTWLPTLMIRSYGMTMAEAGALIGAINGVGGLLVTIVVGVAADRLARHNSRWNLWLPAILFAVAAPFAASTFLSHSPATMLVCFAVSTSVVAACTAPIISYTLQIMPSTVHAMITAFTFLVFNVVGFGLAPLAVGALSDSLTPLVGSGALQQALLYLAAPALILAACFVIIGAWRPANITIVQGSPQERAFPSVREPGPPPRNGLEPDAASDARPASAPRSC
jgi:MFS family permease